MNRRLGIAFGDVTGIGPEVTLKAIARELGRDDTGYTIIGDRRTVEELNDQLGLRLSFVDYSSTVRPEQVAGVDTDSFGLPSSLLPGAPEAAKAAVAWLKTAATLCLRNELDGMVTAPVNKEAIVKAGIPFVGQTELLSDLAQAKRQLEYDRTHHASRRTIAQDIERVRAIENDIREDRHAFNRR